MDLKKISDAHTAEIEIKDPETGAPLGVFFTLAGPEHPKRKNIEFDRQRKIRSGLQKTGKLALTDPEDDELQMVDHLVTSTIAWRGYTDEKGAEIPFTPAAARALYEDEGRGWLRHQLVTAMNERERFIKRSATT